MLIAKRFTTWVDSKQIINPGFEPRMWDLEKFLRDNGIPPYNVYDVWRHYQTFKAQEMPAAA